MPTYEYACKSCGEHVEVVQSFKDDALTECPACGGPLRKVFGNIGIAFKGSGFYKTDSRKSAAAGPRRSARRSSSSRAELGVDVRRRSRLGSRVGFGSSGGSSGTGASGVGSSSGSGSRRVGVVGVRRRARARSSGAAAS